MLELCFGPETMGTHLQLRTPSLELYHPGRHFCCLCCNGTWNVVQKTNKKGRGCFFKHLPSSNLFIAFPGHTNTCARKLAFNPPPPPPHTHQTPDTRHARARARERTYVSTYTQAHIKTPVRLSSWLPVCSHIHTHTQRTHICRHIRTQITHKHASRHLCADPAGCLVVAT